MWEVGSGEILVGGVDIREIPHERLMNLIGFVFQDAFMFSDTVYENIRMGMEGVTEEEVVRAAEAAQCMDFIRALPRGCIPASGRAGSAPQRWGEAEGLPGPHLPEKRTHRHSGTRPQPMPTPRTNRRSRPPFPRS